MTSEAELESSCHCIRSGIPKGRLQDSEGSRMLLGFPLDCLDGPGVKRLILASTIPAFVPPPNPERQNSSDAAPNLVPKGSLDS